MELADKKVRQLTSMEGDEMFPHWSPDGQRIAFTANKAGNLDLYVTDAEGKSVRQLTDHPGRDVWPRWSPDGSQILFFSRRDTDGQDDELYLMPAEGGPARRITNRAGHDFCPAWSPDGQRIAVSAVDEEAGRSIHIIDLQGKVLSCIGLGFVRVTMPVWSPDGTKIAYIARGNKGLYDIYIEEVPATADQDATFSPAGKR